MTTSGSPGTTKLGSEHIAALSSLFGFQFFLVVMTWQDTIVKIIIPAVKTHTLMDLLQKFMSRVELLKNYSDRWQDASRPIADIQYSII